MLPMTQNIIKLVDTIAEQENTPIGLRLNKTSNDVIIAGVDIAGVDTHITTYDTEDDSNLDKEHSIQLEHINLQSRKTYKNIKNSTSNEATNNKYKRQENEYEGTIEHLKKNSKKWKKKMNY